MIRKNPEFIVFRSPQLNCHFSGLSVNVGESMITQSSKVRDLGVIIDLFLKFDYHISAICRSTHFHIRNIGKIRNLLSYDACSTFIHALISCLLYYCNCILTLTGSWVYKRHYACENPYPFLSPVMVQLIFKLIS